MWKILGGAKMKNHLKLKTKEKAINDTFKVAYFEKLSRYIEYVDQWFPMCGLFTGD